MQAALVPVQRLEASMALTEESGHFPRPGVDLVRREPVDSGWRTATKSLDLEATPDRSAPPT